MKNYLDDLNAKREEIDNQAQAYLDSLPFLTNDEIMDRIFAKAKEIFYANNEDWDAVPDWVADTMDGHMPYSQLPRNSSLSFAIGFSPVSRDAHLRHLLEIAEGRATKELPFPVLAKITEPTTTKPTRKTRLAKTQKARQKPLSQSERGDGCHTPTLFNNELNHLDVAESGGITKFM